MTAAVSTPQPTAQAADAQLVLAPSSLLLEEPAPPVAGPPGVAAPRPPHRPGPRPRTLRGAAATIDDFGPSWSRRADLPDLQAVGRRLVTLTLEACRTAPGGPAAVAGQPGAVHRLSDRRRPGLVHRGHRPAADQLGAGLRTGRRGRRGERRRPPGWPGARDRGPTRGHRRPLAVHRALQIG